MRSSISWIDRADLAATLARFGETARQSPRQSPLLAATVPVDDDELDVTPPPPAPPAEPPRVELEEVQLQEVDVRVEEPARHQITVFTPPDGALRSRLEAFIEWLLELTGNDVAFIVDRDGLPLVDREADPDLLAIAASVMQLVESINGKLLFPLGRSVTLELEEKQLALTSVETTIGRYIVGQVGERSLDGPLREALADGLRRAFRPSAEPAEA